MSSSILLEKEEEKEHEWQQQSQLVEESGIPVCCANLSSPIVDQANYIEIHYRIGNRLYIENAN
jgi:hypothetical protein